MKTLLYSFSRVSEKDALLLLLRQLPSVISSDSSVKTMEGSKDRVQKKEAKSNLGNKSTLDGQESLEDPSS